MTHDELIAYFQGILDTIGDERHLVDEFNAGLHEQYERLKLATTVKPCFFSGSLHKGKIVVINLNPKYVPGGAEAEQLYAIQTYGNLIPSCIIETYSEA